MKKLLLVTVILAMAFFPAISMAGYSGGKSTSGSSTVQEFENQCDLQTSGRGLLGGLISAGIEGAKCDEIKFILVGKIRSKVSTNIYEFKDDTGSVYVQIRNWNGLDIGPKDLVRLKGEADIEEYGLVLEVEAIELVK